MKQLGLLLLFTFLLFYAKANTGETQGRLQTVQGIILDKDTKAPLIGATIIVINSDPIIGSSADIDGNFILQEVPVGRQSFLVSYIGYLDQVLENIEVVSGKQTILKVELVESTENIAEVEVTAYKNTMESTNDLAVVSARQFSVEESGRYAGARNDVSRMASNYAGVATSNDARNDIVIRGNAPAGLLWRLEDVNIPDPNHFSGISSNGGAVSMLNYNVISNSDFFTGAFPSEYGNATSGVFDLNLRNGNNQKYEHMVQFGAIGTEFMTEGPLSKKNGSSYLLNYRFSTTSILTAMGIDFGYDGEADYQDFALNIKNPTKIGDFTLFGIGGLSVYKLLAEKISEDNFDFSIAENANQNYGTNLFAGGLSHLVRPNAKSYIKTTIGYTLQQENADVDSVDTQNSEHLINYFDNKSQVASIQLHSYYKYKINARHKLKVGILIDNQELSFDQELYNPAIQRKEIYRDGSDNTTIGNAYVQWAYSPSDQLTITTGVNSMYLELNGSSSIEPRAGMKWKFAKNQSLNIGYGLHSQMQPLEGLFYAEETSEGVKYPNIDLDFTKSHHLIAGYSNQLANHLVFRAETYFQYLFNVPVNTYSSSFSMLNTGTENELVRYKDLVNEGIGRNYGVEVTLERFMNRGMYFLITSSLYNSEYQGSDEVWRNTLYNGRYVLNVLTGKEFKLNDFNKIVFDIKFTTAGGQHFTPIDEEASAQIDRAVYINDEAFSKQQNPYMRTDVKLAYRFNGERTSHEFFINVDNAFNNKNVFMQVYDKNTDKLQTINQLGLFPTFQYKVYF